MKASGKRIIVDGSASTLTPEIMAQLPKSETPVQLVGSDGQCNWAHELRLKMLDRASDAEMFRIILAIDDSSWLIKHRKLGFAQCDWNALVQRAKKKSSV